MEHNIPLPVSAFEQLFQALPTPYLVLSPELYILAANESYLQATGTTHDAILGKYVAAALPGNPQPEAPSGVEILLASVQHVLQTKTLHRIPALRYDTPRPQSKGGGFDSRYWAVTNTPLLAADGTLTCIIQEARDVTEQVKTGQEFIAHHRSLELLAKAAGGAVWEADISKNEFIWSESFISSFGYKDATLATDLSFWETYVHPDDIENTRTAFKKTFDTGNKVFTIEHRLRRTNGTYTPILSHGYVLYDEHGNPAKLIGSSLDMDRYQQQQQQLSISNQRFEYVAKAASDVIWDWNLLNDTIWWNEGMGTLYGYSKEAIEPSSSFWYNRIHPEDAERVNASIRNAINGNQNAWQAEYRFRKADGTYLLIKDTGHFLRDAAGKPLRMVGALIDVTERRRYQKELQDNYTWTEKLLESLPLLVWTATPEGRIDFLTKRSSSYTGAPLAALQHGKWASYIHPSDLEETLYLWQQSLKTGTPYLTECRFKSRTGQYSWFMVHSLPIRDENKTITMWAGSCIDIEDQKQAQLALEQNNRKFKLLAESIPHIIWSATPDGRVDYFNQRYYEYTKMRQEEALGFGWLQALHPQDEERILAAWKHSLATGQEYYMEGRFCDTASRHYSWFMTRAVPIRNEAGKITKWFGTSTDIEDHKKAEEELLEKNLELERVNKDLDSFVYAASHDLKAPIANMAGLFRELTRRTEFKDAATAKVVDMFDRSLQQIHNTIQDLSAVVRVQKSKDQPLELIDLTSLTEEVALSIQDMITRSGAAITIDFSEVAAIPFTRPGLKSILLNLISNAIKYKSPERNPEINISTQVKGDYIELKVRDNGLGIDLNKYQNKLFQMFKRFHNHVPGSGLGLYIVNRLLTNQGGYITIESILNEETTFYLYFKSTKAETTAGVI